MVRIGGFLKTQNRIRRHRARGRFISPYQIGGSIFDKATMVRYPLMHTSSRLLDPHSMIMKHLKQRRRMKGQVRANALSADVPVCFPGEPRKMVDDHGPTPKRYKKERLLNTADIQTPASCSSICLMCLMWITGTRPSGTWPFNPP